MKKMKVLNSKGEEIVLNKVQKFGVDAIQKVANSLGFQADINTLTQISQRVSEQKFFEIKPSDYIPIVPGVGAWASDIVNYVAFSPSGKFEDGLINNLVNGGKLTEVSAGVNLIRQPNNTYAKQITYTIPQVEQASLTGVWDLIEGLEKSRKRDWDLGIQRVAFLGLAGDVENAGLLNQVGIKDDADLITKALKNMTQEELSAFCENVLGAYRANCQHTAWPTHFVIPESDYTGLAAPSSPEFPIKSKLQLLEETFKTMTKNSDFKILPCAYADLKNNTLGKARYVLLNYDPDSLVMRVPVPYTTTVLSTVNGFSFQNAAYGQFTGVRALRPRELFYMGYAA